MQLGGIAIHSDAGRCGDCNAHFVRTGAAHQRDDLIEHIGDIDVQAFLRILAAEGEDLRHQHATALGCFGDGIEITCQRRIDHGGRLSQFAQPLLRHLAVADNGGEDIIEIMRDTTGKLTDCLHLLRLPQLGLQPVLLRFGKLSRGNVFDETDHAALAAYAGGITNMLHERVDADGDVIARIRFDAVLQFGRFNFTGNELVALRD